MELESKYKELVSMANEALKNGYSPYSKLKVGSAVLTRNGGIYLGCNVENASFSITSCAERNAISSAILAEGPEMEIQAISVTSKNANNREAPITPCGACRQAIVEFGRFADVIYTDESGGINVMKINDLIPYFYSAKTFKDD